MANSQGSTKCEGVCEKMYKAICHISLCPQSSKPTRATSTSPMLSSEQKKTTTDVFSTEVPIIFNAPVSSTPWREKEGKEKTDTPIFKNVHVVKPLSAKAGGGQRLLYLAKDEPTQGKREDSINDEFSNYIHRAKAKIRTTSSIGGGVGGDSGGVGEGMIAPRRDSFNDKVTNYINQAKIRIRATSSLGGIRTVSIK